MYSTINNIRRIDLQIEKINQIGNDVTKLQYIGSTIQALVKEEFSRSKLWNLLLASWTDSTSGQLHTSGHWATEFPRSRTISAQSNWNQIWLSRGTFKPGKCIKRSWQITRSIWFLSRIYWYQSKTF